MKKEPRASAKNPAPLTDPLLAALLSFIDGARRDDGRFAELYGSALATADSLYTYAQDYPVRAMRLLRAALLLAPLLVGCAPKPVAVEAPKLPTVPSIYVVETWKGDVLPTEPRP